MIVGITEKTQHHLGKNTVSQQIRDGRGGLADWWLAERCRHPARAGGGRVGGSLSLSSIMMLIARRHPVTEQSALTVKKKESRPDRRPGEARRPSSSLRTEKPQHLMSHDQNSPRFSSSRGDNRKLGDCVTSLCTMTDLKRR